MTIALPQPAETRLPWLVGIFSFLVLFGPVYWGAAHGLWDREEYAHGPLILGIVAWLLWQARAEIVQHQQGSASGWAPFMLGVVMLWAGRTLNFTIFEFAAQIPVLIGICLLIGGTSLVKRLWFPLFFIVFMVPLPGMLVDAATGALKQWISVQAEYILQVAGYPVGRTGVMLVVGHYQLLVADACSGLHSMFTLSAMGMLFMHLKARTSLLHNAVLLAAILPIAFLANLIRVLTLVLITYHLGDEAGQGFMHGAAGIVLIVVALLTLIALDWLLARSFRKKQ